MDISTLRRWMEELPSRLSDRQATIGTEVMKEINKRLDFLLEVGLGYLDLDRPARTLSGGESQRIRLATQIGSQLVGVLYILDEPSIGLHQRDNERLIGSLLRLRDLGNSVLVVEHDKDMMLASDYIIDLGPAAGVHGGEVVAEGTPEQILNHPKSATAEYLGGKREIAIPSQRRQKANDRMLILRGATGNNLKSVDLLLPLGLFVCISGVSGSGKSTLINETLYPILNQHFFKSRGKPMPYRSVEGLGMITNVIEIDQSPIGRTPRSNPATYTGVFTFIRDFFTQLPEARIRGYQPGRFSFNVKGGRCEECGGAGVQTIEMNLLPDVYVTCESCQGRRYNRETLEVRYRGKSISDVLNMTISAALEFFEAHPRIKRKLITLEEVGLGYLTLGQQATTLSGGEAQRVKIATELSKRNTGRTIYILDEPTTGLHFQDIDVLLKVLQRLVDRGNTVVVIEHNLDVIKVADWVVDLGPEGGKGGGRILAEGTPEQVADHAESFTGRFLRKELGLD
jgi:excinuclease ABC subunit A